jgi:charged multivesicular body protein 4
MRLFGFGKKKEAAAGAGAAPVAEMNLPDAIQKNKQAIDTLDKRQKLLEKRIADEEADARSRVAGGDKRGALVTLKRKKMLETELEQLMNSRMTLEQQINSLESAQMNQIAIQALAHGVNVHKQLNKQMDADRVDKLMEDLQEQQDLQAEIAQVMSSGVRLGDDEELLAELAQLEEREMDAKLVDAGRVPTAAPIVNQTATTTAAAVQSTTRAIPAGGLSNEEEEELAKLQSSLS